MNQCGFNLVWNIQKILMTMKAKTCRRILNFEFNVYSRSAQRLDPAGLGANIRVAKFTMAAAAILVHVHNSRIKYVYVLGEKLSLSWFATEYFFFERVQSLSFTMSLERASSSWIAVFYDLGERFSRFGGNFWKFSMSWCSRVGSF